VQSIAKERMGVNFLYIHTHDSGRYLDPSNLSLFP
jgi:hypothetical protein